MGQGKADRGRSRRALRFLHRENQASLKGPQMNALVIIDTDALTPATVFAPGGVEGILSKIETEVRAIDRDISTPDGRENVKSLAYKVARSKTALDEMGKELVSGIKTQAATIDAERRTIRDRLDALKEEVRGPL